MTITQEAIAGQPVFDPNTLPYPPEPTDASYLDGTWRTGMLTSALAGLFKVASDGAGKASVTVGRHTVFAATRPTPEFIKHQLQLVRNYADLRIDRSAEILVQMSDLLSFFGAIAFLDSRKREATLEFLSAVQTVTTLVEAQVKYWCWVGRPIELAPEIQPIIQTPCHSSFPSGHATEAFAIAAVLHRLMADSDARHGIENAAMPFRLAHRIAVNRTVAGVHYPVDSMGGALLGCAIAEAIVAAASEEKVREVTFGDTVMAETDDFLLSAVAPHLPKRPLRAVANEPIVESLWQAAQAEWQ